VFGNELQNSVRFKIGFRKEGIVIRFSGRSYEYGITTCASGGITPGVPTTDFDGISRPQAGAYDIGAYEYH
jgi:hypothetical protein